MRARPISLKRQRGAALLLVLLLALMIFAYGMLQQFSGADVAPARNDRTAAALAQAKQALIAHALLYGETHKTNATPTGILAEDDVTLPPGTLPCPEQNYFANEGIESGSCGARDTSVLGRLPWRSLGIAPLRDGDGECLWYAVAGSYKANPSPHTLNPDSPGQLRIIDAAGNVLTGSDVANRAVAAIIAPGAPLAGQDRAPVTGTTECGGNYAPAAYLDTVTIGGSTYNNAALSTTAGAVSTLVSGRQDGINDRIVYITREEIWDRVEKRTDFSSALYNPMDDGVISDENDDGMSAQIALAQKLAAMIARYGKRNADPDNHELPWPVPAAVSAFDLASFDDMSGIYAGRPPHRVGSSRGSTNNLLVASGCSTYDCRLMIVDKAGPSIGWWRVAGKPLYGPDRDPPSERGQSRMNSPEGWWDKWKDHYFYIVSPEFAPNSSTDWDDYDDDDDPCEDGGNDCLRVNGDRFAAAVIFAGKALPGQVRNTVTDRQNPANYLEGVNAEALTNPTSNNRRELTTTDPGSNDRIVCIRARDLAIDSTCSNGS